MSSPKRRIELSQQAKEDFRDILAYTLTTWGESQLAKYRASIVRLRVLNDSQKCCRNFVLGI